MNPQLHLKPWLANWSLGLRIVLFLILLSGIVQFVAFSLNQAYILSYFGAQPEDITFSIQLTYVGILAMLPILFRFVRYFEMKSILVFMLIFAIVLCVASLITTDLIVFFIIRFFQGIVVCGIAGCVLLEIPVYINAPEFKQSFSSSVFYGTVLSSSVLIGFVAANVELSTNFIEVYSYLTLFLAFILLLVLLGFRNRTGMRRYPLYQIDWIGTCFFVLAAICLAYSIIYGSKYYWFTDSRIRISALLFISGTLLFVWRELTVKRPGLDLNVFRYPKFWAGILLLASYYGMKESINLIFGYTTNILQWSPVDVMYLGLTNVTGIVVFMIITAQLLARRIVTVSGFIIAGFCMMLLYHLWMYFIFTPDLAYEDLMLPMFFQGASSGILFVPIMLLMLSSVPPTTGIAGLVIAADVRFVSLLNASAGFYNLQLRYNQLYKESFLQHLTNTDEQTTERLDGFRQLYQSKGFSPDQVTALANSSLARSLSIQSQLLTNRAVFLYISLIIIIILSILMIVYCIGLYRKHRLGYRQTAAV
jgi:DHA2 family multidrug resistance protein